MPVSTRRTLQCTKASKMINMATVQVDQETFTESLLCPCATVRRASRSVTQLFDMVLAPTGMKATQFVILRIIGAQQSVPQWKLAQEHTVAVETLSRRLAALRKKGLISLQIAGARGEHLYSLTPAGREALERAAPYWQRAQARLQQVVGEEELQRLVSCANRLAGAAQTALHKR